MNIFINISHPAHVHFFKNTISILSRRGHHIIVGARNKEFTLELLRACDIRHVVLTNKGKGLAGLIKELFEQQLKIANILRKHPADIMLQISGVFNAPVGRYHRIPTIAFSDTENDRWGNMLSFPLSRHVVFPACFNHRIGGSWKNQIRYPGYHELAYLSPRYVPGKIRPENKFMVRFVGWGAGHDIGENGLSDSQKVAIINILKKFGTVHISSESQLPDEILKYSCSFHPSEIHDFMMTCKMVVGESATMTSEAACLGIPAIFISNTARGYTTEQDRKYNLIRHYRLNQWEDITRQLKKWAVEDLGDAWQKKRWDMLKDKIDITAWLVDLIEGYPESIADAQTGNFKRYLINCVG
ncbi:DUF354 domain-containing protein [Desulfococcaceae bacterium HSG8]|nr:DUF354 domain-containing protein [Desulfococcaceae bacterium HSG8]